MRSILLALIVHFMYFISHAQFEPIGQFVAVDSSHSLARLSLHQHPQFVLTFSNDTVYYQQYGPNMLGNMKFSAATFLLERDTIITHQYGDITICTNTGLLQSGRLGCQANDTFYIDQGQLFALVQSERGDRIELYFTQGIDDGSIKLLKPILNWAIEDPGRFEDERFIRCK